MAFAQRIVAAVDLLEGFPRAGRVVPEYRDGDLREIICGNYRVIYEFVADDVHVLAV